MTKRLFDIVFSATVLLLASPLLLVVMLLVFLQDGHSPVYRATRVARYNGEFVMMKARSMRMGADRSGVTSTSANDNRITRVGHIIRRLKLDELSQFWNVLIGDMSVVGPRPNTRANGVDLYTPTEMRLLDVKPGITDIASIVFSDEGEILAGASDADALYNRVIRPWKSRLGLLYTAHSSPWLDVRIIWLTLVAIMSRERALAGVQAILVQLGAEGRLREICRRKAPLPEGEPPDVLLCRTKHV